MWVESYKVGLVVKNEGLWIEGRRGNEFVSLNPQQKLTTNILMIKKKWCSDVGWLQYLLLNPTHIIFCAKLLAAMDGHKGQEDLRTVSF